MFLALEILYGQSINLVLLWFCSWPGDGGLVSEWSAPSHLQSSYLGAFLQLKWALLEEDIGGRTREQFYGMDSPSPLP